MKLIEINNTSLLEDVNKLRTSIAKCRTLGVSIRTSLNGIDATEDSIEHKQSMTMLGLSTEALSGMDKDHVLSTLTDKYIEQVQNTIIKFVEVYSVQLDNINTIKEALESIDTMTDEQFASASVTSPDYIWLSDVVETFTGEVNLIRVVEAGINGCILGTSCESSFNDIFDELSTLGITHNKCIIHSDSSLMIEGTFDAALYPSKEDLKIGAKQAIQLLSFGDDLSKIFNSDIKTTLEVAIHLGNEVTNNCFTQEENIATMLNLMNTMLKLSLELPYVMAMAITKAKLS